nr:MAG TPA: hypothetical protein [Crassvirales sp.]
MNSILGTIKPFKVVSIVFFQSGSIPRATASS